MHKMSFSIPLYCKILARAKKLVDDRRINKIDKHRDKSVRSRVEAGFKCNTAQHSFLPRNYCYAFYTINHHRLSPSNWTENTQTKRTVPGLASLAPGFICSWPQMQDSFPPRSPFMSLVVLVVILRKVWLHILAFSQCTDGEKVHKRWLKPQIKKEDKIKFLHTMKQKKKKKQKILPNTRSLCTSQRHYLPFCTFPFLHHRYSDPYGAYFLYTLFKEL